MSSATITTQPAESPKYTKGPWVSSAEVQQFDLGESISVVTADAPRVPIATVLNADDFPCITDDEVESLDMEAQANARLIAAAPELLEACVYVLKNLDHQISFTGRAVIDPHSGVTEMLRFAISKAKGQS